MGAGFGDVLDGLPATRPPWVSPATGVGVLGFAGTPFDSPSERGRERATLCEGGRR